MTPQWSMVRRAYGYWARAYRTRWKGSIVISVANPLLFLVAIGAGLGQLIPATADGVSYLSFFAPGMLAAASMQNGILESSFAVAFARRRGGSYANAAATPLEPVDIMVGHMLYMARQVAISAAAFVLVMVAFGAARSWLVVLTLPAALLTGIAFATPVAAWAVTQEGPQKVGDLFKWVVMPLYLFSGTFFPVEQLPSVLRGLAQLSPLWHGADLCRSLSLGTATWSTSALHVAYLLALTALGIALSWRSYRRYLHS